MTARVIYDQQGGHVMGANKIHYLDMLNIRPYVLRAHSTIHPYAHIRISHACV